VTLIVDSAAHEFGEVELRVMGGDENRDLLISFYGGTAKYPVPCTLPLPPIFLQETSTHLSIARPPFAREIQVMTKEALLAEIMRLPPEDRIELLGDAWDAIAASPDEVLVPEWHLAVLKERLADPEYLSWEELQERLKRAL